MNARDLNILMANPGFNLVCAVCRSVAMLDELTLAKAEAERKKHSLIDGHDISQIQVISYYNANHKETVTSLRGYELVSLAQLNSVRSCRSRQEYHSDRSRR